MDVDADDAGPEPRLRAPAVLASGMDAADARRTPHDAAMAATNVDRQREDALSRLEQRAAAAAGPCTEPDWQPWAAAALRRRPAPVPFPTTALEESP
jgi:hypothetical protein